MGVLTKIAAKLEKVFERNATKAVEDPDQGQQSERDARSAGEDTTKSASDAAVDSAKDHVVHDLRDLGFKAAPKLGWLKFTFAIGVMFSGFLTYFSTRPPSYFRTPEQQAALDTLRHSEELQREVEYLNQVVISPDQMNIMIGGLMARSAPTPEKPYEPAAAAMPPAIAAVADEPITVDLTTNGGQATQEVTSTVGQVYLQSPAPVRRMMEQPDPPKIDHGYDHPDPNDCYVRHCLGGDINRAGGFHKDFTVNAVDGNGVNFGSLHIHN